MAFKLIESAQTRWRCVNALHLVPLVRAGATFVNGQCVELPDDQDQHGWPLVSPRDSLEAPERPQPAMPRDRGPKRCRRLLRPGCYLLTRAPALPPVTSAVRPVRVAVTSRRQSAERSSGTRDPARRSHGQHATENCDREKNQRSLR